MIPNNRQNHKEPEAHTPAARMRLNKAWSAWADVPPGNGLGKLA